ncbi:MAG: DUF4830 domain-containing protein [Oscillospiraceae bacterium]
MTIIIGAAVLLCCLILALGQGFGGHGEGKTAKVKCGEDGAAFLESLGWEVSRAPLEEHEAVIPQKFSNVYSAYNELQIAQGYDLSKYSGLSVTIYTYAVKNYAGFNGEVVADLYVLNYEVIGGDVHSLALDGFMHGLVRSES